MNTKWLIESDKLGEDIPLLVKEIKKQGFECKVITDSVYSDIKWSDLYKSTDCVIFYGSIGMGGLIRRTNWIPGLYSNLHNYDVSYYFPAFNKFLLNSEYALIPYGDLLNKKEWIFRTFSSKDAVFIKPNSGYKRFTGKLVYIEYYDRDVEIFGAGGIRSEELVLVSPPYNILEEYRFFVVDNKVISGTEYKPDKIELKNNNEAWLFAEKVLSEVDYSPDRAWTLDICKTVYDYYVLEIGCFSCAGLYKANLEPIVKEVSRVAFEDYKDFYE